MGRLEQIASGSGLIGKSRLADLHRLSIATASNSKSGTAVQRRIISNPTGIDFSSGCLFQGMMHLRHYRMKTALLLIIALSIITLRVQAEKPARTIIFSIPMETPFIESAECGTVARAPSPR